MNCLLRSTDGGSLLQAFHDVRGSLLIILLAKGMSWIKTNVMIEMSDRTTESVVADLITDGCNMGIKSLYRYQNQYSQAKHSAKEISRRLIDIEEQLRQDMQKYL